MATAYWELLKDPRWQKKRLEILERDKFACKRCGATDKELHVHHTYYIKDHKPWEYDGGALKTVCKPCHEIIGEENEEIKRMLSLLFHRGQEVLGILKAMVLSDYEEAEFRRGGVADGELLGIARMNSLDPYPFVVKLAKILEGGGKISQAVINDILYQEDYEEAMGTKEVSCQA